MTPALPRTCFALKDQLAVSSASSHNSRGQPPELVARMCSGLVQPARGAPPHEAAPQQESGPRRASAARRDAAPPAMQHCCGSTLQWEHLFGEEAYVDASDVGPSAAGSTAADAAIALALRCALRHRLTHCQLNSLLSCARALIFARHLSTDGRLFAHCISWAPSSHRRAPGRQHPIRASARTEWCRCALQLAASVQEFKGGSDNLSELVRWLCARGYDAYVVASSAVSTTSQSLALRHNYVAVDQRHGVSSRCSAEYWENSRHHARLGLLPRHVSACSSACVKGN